jgi:hypothetical protein
VLAAGGRPWTYTVIAIWALGSFYLFENLADDISIIPVTILAFCIAIGPWGYFATKGPKNDGDVIALLFLSISSSAMSVRSKQDPQGVNFDGRQIFVIIGS